MEKTPRIVPVSMEEAPVIYAANEVEARLFAEARDRGAEASKTAGRSLQDPLLMYNTQREAEILKGRDDLVRKYRKALNLETNPILVLPIPSQTRISPEGFGRDDGHFHQYCRKEGGQLSQMALVECFLKRVSVCRKNGTLYVWNGNHFHRVSDGEMRGLIGEVLREELRFTNASSMIGSILSLLQSERRIQEEPDLHSGEIALQNGVLDFMSLSFRQPNPNSFNDYFLDSPWHENAPCPTFQAFLWAVSGGNTVLTRRMLEAIGFLLAPGNEAKRFILFRGVPNSGKSVIGNLIQTFFLPGDVSGLPLHQFGDRFAMSAVAGRHLNVSMDLPSGVIDGRSAAIIKQITGGDLVFVEGKGKEGSGRHVRCKFLFGTNHPVELRVRDEAFAERILLIPFCISVPKNQRDTGLLDKLRQEKPGILYQTLMAYREVVRRNYQFTGEDEFGFKLGELVVSGQSTESIGSFVKQCCILAPDSFASSEALHQAFTIFCQGSGFPLITDRPSFSRALKTHLSGQITPVKRRVNGVPLNGYTGIGLKQ